MTELLADIAPWAIGYIGLTTLAWMTMHAAKLNGVDDE